MMRSGETFKLEDFPGRDTSFRRNLEKKNTGRLPKDEKCDPVSVHQRNLRPRKPVLFNIEESSSSGDSEPPGPPHSGRCTHEDLKPWMRSYRTRLMKLGEIYAGVWVCPRKPSILTGRGKPAMIIIDSLPLLQVLDSKPSGQPGRESKETTLHQNRERRARKTRVTLLDFMQEMRTPNAAEDAQQQETPSTAMVLYEDVLCAQPQSYVSPPKAFCRLSRLPSQVGGGGGGESNPHLYRSVGTVRSIHPSWKANPSSKGKVASTGIEDGGVPLSQQVPNTGEKLAKVPSLIMEDGGQDPPIVEETSPEFPVMEEEERYDCCREDLSTDTQMHEKQGNPVSKTEQDSSFVPSGGKRQRKRSNKICGVYTLDGRVKKLFESEKKVEYRPLAKTNRAVYKKFSEILSENPAQ
ncbi:hypothetical protein Bca52824_026316 [Brassica carinata]|uniref:Uncharacterized protein n=1 Tax=Brassica carinata TaxID=52824 RepID=A0A8X7SHR8_BRACI|nr:hypothetical protein Bca52824_026316 [Brassica carinata]